LLFIDVFISSNAEVFINTGLPDKRVKKLKSRKKLRSLPEDSEDIFEVDLLDHYVHRPDDLEYICLADFAALYTYSKTLNRTRQQSQGDRMKMQSLEQPYIHFAMVVVTLRKGRIHG